jgi:hypothetical protein
MTRYSVILQRHIASDEYRKIKGIEIHLLYHFKEDEDFKIFFRNVKVDDFHLKAGILAVGVTDECKY